MDFGEYREETSGSLSYPSFCSNIIVVAIYLCCSASALQCAYPKIHLEKNVRIERVNMWDKGHSYLELRLTKSEYILGDLIARILYHG